MTSKSHQNVVSILSLTDGLLSLLDQEYKGRAQNKTVKDLVVAISEELERCYAIWPGDIEESTLQIMNKRLSAFEARIFGGRV